MHLRASALSIFILLMAYACDGNGPSGTESVPFDIRGAWLASARILLFPESPTGPRFCEDGDWDGILEIDTQSGGSFTGTVDFDFEASAAECAQEFALEESIAGSVTVNKEVTFVIGSLRRMEELIESVTLCSVLSPVEELGLGESDLGPLELTPSDEVEDLHAALATLELPVPGLLIAHSYGAMLATVYARRFPDEVAGLVLVEPNNARFIAATGDWIYTTVPNIREPVTNLDHVLMRMKVTLGELSRESGEAEPTLTQPIVVITAGQAWLPQGIADSWWESHHDIVAERANRSLLIAEESGHNVPADQPEIIVDATVGLMNQTRRD